ncbi:MAG: class I SAM-dependent methyltransferase [Thermoplasmata archaeon]
MASVAFRTESGKRPAYSDERDVRVSLEAQAREEATKVKELAEDIGGQFDAEALAYHRAYVSSGLAESSRVLLDELASRGLKEKRLLDLGSGVGSFSFEALKRGAGSTVGIDLSPEMVSLASRLSVKLGMGERADFTVGNAATTDLPASEIVILDRVLCCYPERADLLRNSARASTEFVAFVVPRNEGLLRILGMPIMAVFNFLSRSRGEKAYHLPDIAALDRTLTAEGFSRIFKRASGTWLAYIYEKQALNIPAVPPRPAGCRHGGVFTPTGGPVPGGW